MTFKLSRRRIFDAIPAIDPRLTVSTETCTSKAIIHYDTDFAVISTDADEIETVIRAAGGMLGQFVEGKPNVQTFLNGASILSNTITDFLTPEPKTAKQELKVWVYDCDTDLSGEGTPDEVELDVANEATSGKKGRKLQVDLEMIGSWVVTDPEARQDEDEYAMVHLYLRVDGEDDSFTGSHAKYTKTPVPIPIPRSKDDVVRFKASVTTKDTQLPVQIYAKLVESAQTDGPGNSAINPLDLIQDAFTTSVSGVHVDSIFITVKEL